MSPLHEQTRMLHVWLKSIYRQLISYQPLAEVAKIWNFINGFSRSREDLLFSFGWMDINRKRSTSNSIMKATTGEDILFIHCIITNNMACFSNPYLNPTIQNVRIFKSTNMLL